MPAKQKPIHKKHSKNFLKVYAPYLPLLVIVGIGMFVSLNGTFQKKSHDEVLSYASGITADTLLQDTNKERDSDNLKGLKLNSQLNAAAQAKAQDMSNKNYWSHVTPDGKEPSYFVEKSGYKYSKIGENLAYGFGTSKATVSGWMNSPSHRANVMDESLTEVGFGVANASNFQNKGPETIIVAIYGKPSESAVQSATAQNIASEQSSISHIQTITDGRAPWSGFAFGLLIGGIIVYLILTHAKKLREALRISEKFIVKHPVLDMTLLALLALGAILIQSAGTIY